MGHAHIELVSAFFTNVARSYSYFTITSPSWPSVRPSPRASQLYKLLLSHHGEADTLHPYYKPATICHVAKPGVLALLEPIKEIKMNMFSVFKFKTFTFSLLLLGLSICTSPARADFGLGGLEFSPVRTFASVNSDSLNTYSGTVIFNLSNPTTELAIPILWSEGKEDEYEDGYKELVMDIQWRKFDKPSRSGGYVGVLARGVSTRRIDRYATTANNTRETDFGLGLVAGFRKNISSGFYWGMNANIVAFANEPEDLGVGESELYRQKVSFTFDFLKIGYQF